MSRFTVSSANVLQHCRFPFRDDVTMPPEAAADADCELGTEVHAACEREINRILRGKDDPMDEPDSPKWLCAKAWIRANHRDAWVAEPAYAWNPEQDTAWLLGVDIDRKYEDVGMLPGERGSTLDVCSVEGDTVYVYEFGTGFDVSHKYDQMRLQCLVAARAHGKSRAVGQVVRFADDGAYPQPAVYFDDFDLAAIAGEFAGYLAEVDGSEPTPGEHCTRCNLAPVCPAAAKIIRDIVPAGDLVRGHLNTWKLTIDNADHAAWLLNHARLVAAAAERVKDMVKAYVPREGMTLADGSLLIEGTRNVPRKNHARIEALARTLGATDEQIESCTVTATESAGLKIKKPAKAKKAKAA